MPLILSVGGWRRLSYLHIQGQGVSFMRILYLTTTSRVLMSARERQLFTSAVCNMLNN